jgi:hypothetical protein
VRTLFIAGLLTVLLPAAVFGYNILYAEQYYKLYHQNMYQYPEDFRENVWYLERALERPFVNPLNALADIDNKLEWRRYRYLFHLHLNLEMVKQYRRWAAEYDKRNAFFYNYPWKNQNIESLSIAEQYYRKALYYWDQALTWWARLREVPYVELKEVQYWEDEYARIRDGDLDYGEIIREDLQRLNKVRTEFERMDEDTY